MSKRLVDFLKYEHLFVLKCIPLVNLSLLSSVYLLLITCLPVSSFKYFQQQSFGISKLQLCNCCNTILFYLLMPVLRLFSAACVIFFIFYVLIVIFDLRFRSLCWVIIISIYNMTKSVIEIKIAFQNLVVKMKLHFVILMELTKWFNSQLNSYSEIWM